MLGNILSNPPCRSNCEGRTETCHTVCLMYKQWKEDYEKARDAYKEKVIANSEYYQIRQAHRPVKHKGR